LDFFEDFEPDIDEDSMDPQSPLASAPKRLSESFAEGLDRWFTFKHAGFVVFSTFELVEVYLGCLLNRAGTFLIIVEKESHEKHLENVEALLKKAWKVSENLKVFLLIEREVFALNPFAIAGGESFGILEKLPDGEVNREYRNFNGYPINVEIFASAYSVPRGNFTGKLESFHGPDVEVARFIQQQMNVTSNYIEKSN
jgi:hypothetical protein